ncbi:calcium-binding protein [Flavobacterium piscis]|uniref:Delta-60 repeat protein n=1 Tax=Flavobacterium piscis TaxID=1114874 RepID=A0ABU1Y5L4_9FLAO|nr:calcium-binding protein [Flavobacterium piscis]MDR7209517.1 putative delta-60 repeat protein [Flavobacterium piscis]
MSSRLYLYIVILLFSITNSAQQGKLDSDFNTFDDGFTGDGFDNTVRTLSLQSDGCLIVGGDYLNLNGKPLPSLCRLKADGIVDATFNLGTGFNGKIYTSYIQSDDKIILGGNFTGCNGVAVGRLIRLNTNGSHDVTFNTAMGAGNGIIYQIAQQSDGKIIIAGSFTTYNGTTVNRIARILPDGSLDPAFITGSGTSSNITTIQVQPDGKIILAGNFTAFNNVDANKIIRLNSDGSIDPTLNTGTGFNDDCTAMMLQTDGKILVGGKFTQYNGQTANRITRLNPDGSIDSGFLSGTGLSNGIVYTIKTDISGNIMLGGSFSHLYDGSEVNRLVLLNSNGTIKPDFDIGSGPASASVFALNDVVDGSWFIGGSFSVFDSKNQGRLAKIEGDGVHDIGYLTAGVGFDNSVLKVLPLSDTKTMVVGNFSKFNGISSSRVARIFSNGELDATFNSIQTGANNTIKAIAQQLDGKMILGGSFTVYNGTIYNRLVRIFADGEIDAGFISGDGCNGQVFAIAIQSDQKIIVAGNFTKYNGINSNRIVRLMQDGTIDAGFNTGLGADATIEAMLVQPNGKIVLAGRFNSFNGLPHPRIVRLNSDGNIDTDFSIGTGFDKNVYAMDLQSDGKIIVGGSFLSYNGASQKRILRLNPNGILDVTFESGTGFSNGDVRSILVQPDNRIVVGGTFSGNYNGHVSLRLLRLQAKGTYDASFIVSLNSTLYTMGFTADYKLMIGGNFNSVSGIAKHRIALLKLCNNSSKWDGLNWSNGIPSDEKELTFEDDYIFSASANACSCSIDSGKIVTVSGGRTLGLGFDYKGAGILVLEDTASLYQFDDEMINTGMIHIKRKSTPILKFDYTYWSSPVENQKLIDVSPNTLSDKFFSYDYDVKNWKQEIPSTAMIAGKGYIIRGPQDFSTTIPAIHEAVFKGIPTNGKITAAIGVLDSYNLIGNPYSSAIDADVFLNKNSEAIKGTLYFWTHNTALTNKYNHNDYAVYNLLGGVGTRPALASGINETEPGGTIASGQSFFVQSIVAGEVKFDNSMRIIEQNATFFKPGKNKNNKKGKTEKNRIWLNLTNKEALFKQLLVGYAEGATDKYDVSFDGETFNGHQYVNFYSINENKNWVIQARGLPFPDADLIPLGYQTEIKGDFSISIDHLDGIFTNQSVFLEDKEKNVLHDLKKQSYDFSTEKGTYNDRFMLKFTDEKLDAQNQEFKNNSILVYQFQNQLRVKTATQQIQKVQVFDILGRLTLEENFNQDEIILNRLKPENQFIILKIYTVEGKIITEKVLF